MPTAAPDRLFGLRTSSFDGVTIHKRRIETTKQDGVHFPCLFVLLCWNYLRTWMVVSKTHTTCHRLFCYLFDFSTVSHHSDSDVESFIVSMRYQYYEQSPKSPNPDLSYMPSNDVSCPYEHLIIGDGISGSDYESTFWDGSHKFIIFYCYINGKLHSPS